MSEGIVGMGKEGSWMISIMADSEEEAYSISIRSPSVCLQFGLPHLGVLGGLREFLCNDGPGDRLFELENCLGGALTFFVHDGSLRIRLIVPRDQLFEASFAFSEADVLGRALRDALVEVVER